MMDSEIPIQANPSASIPPQVNTVAFRAPPFWPEDIELWLAQVEANFEVCHITRDSTKFFMAVAALDQNALRQAADIIKNPPPTDKYDALRTRLVERLAESDQARIKKVLNDLEIGDRKPSIFLQEMKMVADDKFGEELLRNIWMQRLPHNIQAIIAISEEQDLTKLSKLADKIHEVTRCHVEAASRPPLSTVKVGENDDKRISRLESKIDELHRRLDSQYRSESRGRYRRSSRGRSPSPVEPSWCWYHQNYRHKARRCKSPCSFSTGNGPADH